MHGQQNIKKITVTFIKKRSSG